FHVAARDPGPPERAGRHEAHDALADGMRVPASVVSVPQTRSTFNRLLTAPFTLARPSTYADAERSPTFGASCSSSAAPVITSDTESTMIPIRPMPPRSATSTTMMHVRSV